jgi:hypothetical protein
VCPDSEALVSLLYDELDGSEGVDRRTLTRHIETCERCAAEFAALGGVRQSLREWAEPEMALGFRVVAEPPRRAGWLSNLGLPSWAMPALPLAAAAVIVLGAALGLARLDVQYDANGFRLRTGWGASGDAVLASSGQASNGQASNGQPGMQATTAAAAGPISLAPPGTTPSGTSATAMPVSLAPPPASTAATPWRNDLVALERQIRQEMIALRRSGAAAGDAVVTAASHLEGDPSTPLTSDQALLRRIQQLIDQSEVRQQQNLALRVAELSRDFDVSRRTDLVRMEQGFGRLAEQREQDAQQQRVLINSIRVTQQP